MTAPAEPETRRGLAPGALGKVQAFINSADLELGTDELAEAGRANRWFASQGAKVGTLRGADLERLVAVREALRALLGGPGEGAANGATVHRLDRLLSTAPLRATVSADGAVALAGGSGVDGYLATLAAAMVVATADGTWPRLKVCADDSCAWAYYDHSKNGRGVWCTMRVCGSRNKARAYRARRRARVD